MKYLDYILAIAQGTLYIMTWRIGVKKEEAIEKKALEVEIDEAIRSHNPSKLLSVINKLRS